jgi:ubiquinone/menaquinone biosynthesis C-methylase UbiE
MLSSAAMSASPMSPLAHGRNRITSGMLAGVADGAEMLDYGCGEARFAIALSDERGLSVHACDIDPELVGELARAHGSSVDFFVLPEQQPDLPFPDRQLAAVTCCDVLEHMPEPLRLRSLEEMRRVLSDDGVLVITTPHRGLFSFADTENAKFRFPRLHKLIFTAVKGRAKYQERYGGDRYGNFSEDAERHVHFSAAELSRTIEAAGFRIQEVRYFTLIAPLLAPVLWLIETLARRRSAFNPLRALCWKIYVWDADLEPGRLGNSVAIRATPARGWKR